MLATIKATAARQAARQEAQAQKVEIWMENWPAYRVFSACATQWRRAGMSGVPAGIDYAALPAICGALEIPLDEALLARISVMESAALGVMLEKRP